MKMRQNDLSSGNRMKIQRSAHLTVEPCVSAVGWRESMERKKEEQVMVGTQGGVKSAPCWVWVVIVGLADLTTRLAGARSVHLN